MKKYVNVSLAILEEDFELAYAVLIDYNFIGMEELFDEIILSFAEEQWNDEIKNNLMQRINTILPNTKIIKEEIIEEKNWIEEWEKNVEPIKISDNIIITPAWKASDTSVKLKIIINPKMAFGTGQHATTKLMAKLVEKVAKPGQIWIDAGTGTGVLAIIAAKLGAEKVFAFDNDEWSYDNAADNANVNGVADKIEISLSGINEYDFPQVDCISANMFLNLIIHSLPKFYNSLKNNNGILLISGILIYDRDELVIKAAENNFKLIDELHEDEWCCFHFIAT